MLRYKTKPDLV